MAATELSPRSVGHVCTVACLEKAGLNVEGTSLPAPPDPPSWRCPITQEWHTDAKGWCQVPPLRDYDKFYKEFFQVFAEEAAREAKRPRLRIDPDDTPLFYGDV